MRRQGLLNLAASLVGSTTLAYVLVLCARAWSQFGLSGTLAMISLVALVLLLATGLYAWGALLFLTRAVSKIDRTSEGLLLSPASHCHFSSLVVASVKRVRSFEHFVLFKAGGRFWIAPSAGFVDGAGT
jgi:hypothetical protein